MATKNPKIVVTAVRGGWKVREGTDPVLFVKRGNVSKIWDGPTFRALVRFIRKTERCPSAFPTIRK